MFSEQTNKLSENGMLDLARRKLACWTYVSASHVHLAQIRRAKSKIIEAANMGSTMAWIAKPKQPSHARKTALLTKPMSRERKSGAKYFVCVYSSMLHRFIRDLKHV